MNLLTIASIAATLALYGLVAVCAGWAWHTRAYLLAVALTIIFLVATVALIAIFDRWGNVA